MAAQGDGCRACLHIPDLDRLVTTPREQPLAVRRQHPPHHTPPVPPHAHRSLSRLSLPPTTFLHSVSPVPAPREQPFAVRRQPQARNTICLSAQDERFLAALHVPALDGPVRAPREQPLAVRRQHKPRSINNVPA